jgi:hypothetical protein
LMTIVFVRRCRLVGRWIPPLVQAMESGGICASERRPPNPLPKAPPRSGRTTASGANGVVRSVTGNCRRRIPPPIKPVPGLPPHYCQTRSPPPRFQAGPKSLRFPSPAWWDGKRLFRVWIHPGDFGLRLV